MQKNIQKIASGFLAALMLFVAASPAHASESEYVATESFWNWLYQSMDGGNWFNSAVQAVVGYACDEVCAYSSDGYHRSSSFDSHVMTNVNGKRGYLCECDYCGETFTAYETDVKQSYDTYVATLPASSYDSSGQLRWRLNISSYDTEWAVDVSSFIGGPSFMVQYTSVGTGGSIIVYTDEFKAPVSGNYHLGIYLFGTGSHFGVIDSNGRYDGNYFFSYSDLGKCASLRDIKNGLYYEFPTVRGFSAGNTVVEKDMFYLSCNSPSFSLYSGYVDVICFPASLPGGSYDTNSRPTTITGGNYGIIGDNGQITKVEDNSTIINETNNTYYNPATGETGTITNWSYDYSDRSYNITLESGDTVTVTYGDENITIKEGDTVYNVYYITVNNVGGSGSGSGSDSHTHDWRESGVIDATCIESGKIIYTCAICSDTKWETTPALGHDWRILRTVTTQYDENGVEVQRGYIIYECDRCHEQYKTEDTSARPTPGGGTTSGTGSGSSGNSDDEEESGGFFGWLFGKIGDLLGAVGEAALNLLKSILDKLFDGLISLVTGVIENLASLVDIFGSFGDALGVLWTWLPPEIMAVLAAGVSIFVIFALLKIFIK